MTDLNASQVKVEAALAGGLLSISFWSNLLQELGFVAQPVAQICGAIVGIVVVYRLIRGKGPPPPLMALCLIALSSLPASAHVMDHPEWDEWFNAQKLPDGSHSGGRADYCCDKTDAYLINEDTELRSAEGDPEVLIDGAWHRFPNRGVGNPGNTVMGATDNPTGHMVAWLYHGYPRCLAGDSKS